MSRRFQWLSLFAVLGLALAGMLIFAGGLMIEIIQNAQGAGSEGLSPVVQLALVGLCLAGAMFLLWFALVGLLLARQTREQDTGMPRLTV